MPIAAVRASKLGFDEWPVTGTPLEIDGGCMRQPLV